MQGEREGRAEGTRQGKMEEAYEADAGRESYELTISASVDYYGGDRMRGFPPLSCTVELHTYGVCPLSQRVSSYQLIRCPYDICSAEINPTTAGNVAETAVSVIAEQLRWQGLPLPDLGDLREHIRFYMVHGALGIPRSGRYRSCIEFQVAVHATVLTPDVMRLPLSTDREAAAAAPDQPPGATAEDGGDDDCAICLEKVAAGGGRCVLPCSHAFHGGCIARWLQHKADCPLCRAEINVAL